MTHISSDMLMDYFYKELDYDISSQVENHLDHCDECQKNFDELNVKMSAFKKLNDKKAASHSFDQILLKIEKKESSLKIWKLFSIFTALSSFILVAFYLNSEAILSIPWLNYLNEFELFMNLDSFTKTLLLFLVFGSICSLAITPILIYEEEKTQEGYYHETT